MDQVAGSQRARHAMRVSCTCSTRNCPRLQARGAAERCALKLSSTLTSESTSPRSTRASAATGAGATTGAGTGGAGTAATGRGAVAECGTCEDFFTPLAPALSSPCPCELCEWWFQS
jgi:hypothetical protein